MPRIQYRMWDTKPNTHLVGRPWLNRHSNTTNVYKLDAYAGTGSIRLGCLVPMD